MTRARFGALVAASVFILGFSPESWAFLKNVKCKDVSPTSGKVLREFSLICNIFGGTPQVRYRNHQTGKGYELNVKSYAPVVQYGCTTTTSDLKLFHADVISNSGKSFHVWSKHVQGEESGFVYDRQFGIVRNIGSKASETARRTIDDLVITFKFGNNKFQSVRFANESCEVNAH